MLLTAITHLNCLRPIIPTVALLGVSPTILLTHTSWRIVSMVLPRNLFFQIEDAIWGWYQKFVVFIFESCSGMKITLKGEIPHKIENAIAICNHQTTMDWIVMDFLALRQGMGGHMRYVFKNALKYFPMYGYVWGVHGGIFVRRDGTYNAKKMKDTLQMLINQEVPLYLVIYPEGTRFHPGKERLLEKSRSYALQNRLEPMTHVLTPRIKAFHCALSSLKGYADAVYDVTIIYESENDSSSGTGRTRLLAPSMWNVLAGQCRRVFVRFERIPAHDVPLVDGMESPTFKWLHMRFKKKDQLLKKYYCLPRNDKEESIQPEIENLTELGADLPTANTTFAAGSLLFLTGLLLSTPTGRMVYSGTLICGSVLGMLYAHFLL